MKRNPTRDGDATDRHGDDQGEAKPLGRDERVSLYPLDPADALRALLNTPPSPRNTEKARRDSPANPAR